MCDGTVWCVGCGGVCSQDGERDALDDFEAQEEPSDEELSLFDVVDEQLEDGR